MNSEEKRNVIAILNKKYPYITLSKIQELINKHGPNVDAISQEIDLLMKWPATPNSRMSSNHPSGRPISYPAALISRPKENQLNPPPIPPRSPASQNNLSVIPPTQLLQQQPANNGFLHQPPMHQQHVPDFLPLTIDASVDPSPEEMYNYLYLNQRPMIQPNPPPPIQRIPSIPLLQQRSSVSQQRVNDQKQHIDALRERMKVLQKDYEDHKHLIYLTQELETRRNQDPDYPRECDVTYIQQMVLRLKQRMDKDSGAVLQGLRHSISCPMDFLQPNPNLIQPQISVYCPTNPPPPTAPPGSHPINGFPSSSLPSTSSPGPSGFISPIAPRRSPVPTTPSPQLSALDAYWPPLAPTPVGNTSPIRPPTTATVRTSPMQPPNVAAAANSAGALSQNRPGLQQGMRPTMQQPMPPPPISQQQHVINNRPMNNNQIYPPQNRMWSNSSQQMILQPSGYFPVNPHSTRPSPIYSPHPQSQMQLPPHQQFLPQTAFNNSSPKICLQCDSPNSADATHCERCQNPLKFQCFYMAHPIPPPPPPP